VDFKEKKQAVGLPPQPQLAAMQRKGKKDRGCGFKRPINQDSALIEAPFSLLMC
jgi:hypothetical protein